jgi:phosphatidylserine decarboxylase
MRIAKAGWPFVIGCAAAGVVITLIASHFGSVMLGMMAGIAFLGAAFCAYFFRDPVRIIPGGDHLILSPADGTITEVLETNDPSWSEPVWVMRIFLSVFDPHIQRTPVAGTVGAIKYTRGCFIDARHPKACIENEQNRVEVKAAAIASPIAVTQIAGLIARRIVCWVKEGQTLQAGEQIGLIRFGSQVNVVIPKNARLKVKAGDYIRAGCDVIAELPK